MNITLAAGPFGTFILQADNGETILIQMDWDYPGVASAFGWLPCTCGATDGTVDCDHQTASEMIYAAEQFLHESIGHCVADPGYFAVCFRPRCKALGAFFVVRKYSSATALPRLPLPRQRDDLLSWKSHSPPLVRNGYHAASPSPLRSRNITTARNRMGRPRNVQRTRHRGGFNRCYAVRVYYELTVPASNDRSPRYMEKALAGLHGSLSIGEQITLGIGALHEQVSFYLRLPNGGETRFLPPLLASYPQASSSLLAAADEPVAALSSDWRCWSASLTLMPQLFPILRHTQFEDMLNRRYADPLDGVLATLRPQPGLRYHLELSMEAAAPQRVQQARAAVKLLDRPFFREHEGLATLYAQHVLGKHSWLARFLSKWGSRSPEPARSVSLDVSASRTHEREADLQAAADKFSGHLFSVALRIVVMAPASEQRAAHQQLHSIAAALGAFTRSRLSKFSLSAIQAGWNAVAESFFLSSEELATLWHFPMAGAGVERMASSSFIEREPPAILPTNEPGNTCLGNVRYRDDTRTVTLRRDDRRRHLYVVGKTGMGKSTLLLNQIQQDIAHGQGVALVDPHGDLADTVLQHIPRERTADVILFDAGNREQAVGFNPLACNDPSRIDQVASGVVASLKKLYDSWGPRLEDTLRNAVYVAIERQGTFLDVLRILGEASYRAEALATIRDPVVRSFWHEEFASWNRAYRTEAVAAIQNKIRPFLTNRTVRAIVSQSDRSLDLRQAMDNGQVLIVNLSKGRLGEDNSALLGALLVTSLQQAAMTRADIPEEQRRDFYLYVDEFQNFTTGSFATILSEARKYRLNLTLSHQYLAQLDPATAAAVAGNVGSIISFAVGSEDAEFLVTAMSKGSGQLATDDLTNLPKYIACTRLLIDGTPTAPFTIATAPPPTFIEDRSSIVREQSHRNHARPVAEVLARIEQEFAKPPIQ